MDIKSIETDVDYRQALKRLDEIFDAPIGTADNEEADKLCWLIDVYEKKHYPIE